MTEKEEKTKTIKKHRSDAQAPVDQSPKSRWTPPSHLPPVSMLSIPPHGVGHPFVPESPSKFLPPNLLPDRRAQKFK